MSDFFSLPFLSFFSVVVEELEESAVELEELSLEDELSDVELDSDVDDELLLLPERLSVL